MDFPKLSHHCARVLQRKTQLMAMTHRMWTLQDTSISPSIKWYRGKDGTNHKNGSNSIFTARENRLPRLKFILQHFQQYSDNSFEQLFTSVLLLYHYDLKTKQFMKWQHNGPLLPKKFKTQKSAGKVMTIFRRNEQFMHNIALTWCVD